MIKITLRSPAKLNLFLKILSKRKDNYHNIKTVFERIALFDTIFFGLRPDGKITVSCDKAVTAKKEDNLVYRAAILLKKRMRVPKGAKIRITKRIPIGAGLGGGSSNAAYALLGLNRLWHLGLAKEKLIALAKELGSDTAFFIYNSPFAIGSGRGEIIAPLKSLRKLKLWHVLAVPQLRIPTPFIYKKWSQSRKARLTTAKSDVKILTSALRNKDLSLLPLLLFNDLEKATFRLYPKVKGIKHKLFNLGLKSILMSGSGPAIFAVVSSRKEAVSLRKKIKRQHKSWRVLAVKTF